MRVGGRKASNPGSSPGRRIPLLLSASAFAYVLGSQRGENEGFSAEEAH